VFSLLSDMFDHSKRVGISALVQVATGVGLAAGQGIAGFVGTILMSCCIWEATWPFSMSGLALIR
jgi:hypothetical protein